MENELRYQVRSREVVDLVSAMRSNRLTLSPYFQRNLVWRDTHKRDFIDTILKGFPFPQIFLARGPIDVETMASSQCVVDGQQRLNTIFDFIAGKIDINGKTFGDLEIREKEAFLKYEIAVIDFDLDAGDPRLKDVFHRLNRTYYSLSAIEKIASEYSASEFLLVARALCGEIRPNGEVDDEVDDIDSTITDAQIDPDIDNSFIRDPGIESATWDWLYQHSDGAYKNLIGEKNIFSNFEFDRKVPLMFTLNIMCTYLAGYFNRNLLVRKYLEDKNSEFPEKNDVVEQINLAASFIVDLDLPPGSMWFRKANFFTLLCEVLRNGDCLIDAKKAKTQLLDFGKSVPSDYALAAREGVSRKSQRDLRAKAVKELIRKR